MMIIHFSKLASSALIMTAIASSDPAGAVLAQQPVPPPPERGTSQTICVPLNLIQAAEVVNDREVILTLRDGVIELMTLAESCPQLKYHGHFTYRATGGQLCEGQDKIVTRSGDACTILTFVPVENASQPKPQSAPKGGGGALKSDSQGDE